MKMQEIEPVGAHPWHRSFDPQMVRQWRIQDFPEVGPPTLQGVPRIILPSFPKILNNIERIWTRGGARPSRPLRSATVRVADGVVDVEGTHGTPSVMGLILSIYYAFWEKYTEVRLVLPWGWHHSVYEILDSFDDQRTLNLVM